jgi:hypothetical protein
MSGVVPKASTGADLSLLIPDHSIFSVATQVGVDAICMMTSSGLYPAIQQTEI